MGEDPILQIKEIFHSLQGEGPFVGTPSIFIRLSGCNLRCPWCDTNFEGDISLQKCSSLTANLAGSFPNSTKHAVITGGEPFLQDIRPLVEMLMAKDYLVTIETNGTINPSWLTEYPYWEALVIVCSPKPGAKVNISPNYWKVLVNRNSTMKDIAKLVGGATNVFLQPLDDGDPVKNKKNTDKAIQLCLENGFRLSLQTHKLLGLR